MNSVKNPNISGRCATASRFIIMMTALFFAAGSAAQPVPLFSATYDVRYGILHGEMTLELRRGNDAGYIYETSLTPRGIVTWFKRGSIVETTSLEIEDNVLKPVDYRSTDTIANPTRYTEYLFDTPPGRVTGVYKERKVNEPLRPNGHNRISAHVAVMLAMNTGTKMNAISVFDRDRWRDFEFETFPGQTVKTPLGEFETVEVRYSSDSKNKSWSLHCAEALDYAPVMIVYREDDDIKSRAQLIAYESLAEAPASQPQPISSR
jgi:hypothetical protein